MKKNAGNEPAHEPKLEGLREKLAGQQGARFWRSLEEYEGTDEFQRFLKEEFPQGQPTALDAMGRRDFFRVMAASMAMAGLTGCRPYPTEKIVPYVDPPKEFLPGTPIEYASSFEMGGIGAGLIVKSRDGRPTKIEGNPDHPGSLGSTDLFAQAEVLNLYDPDRARSVRYRGRISTWEEFLEQLQAALTATQAPGTPAPWSKLRVLTQTVGSPTTAALLAKLQQKFPGMKWHQYEPINRDNAYRGAMAAFGEAVWTRYDFKRANVVVSLEADFLSPSAGQIPHARAFMGRRQAVGNDASGMNRLYAVESTPSLTGTVADHRLSLKASQVEGFARALLARLEGTAGAPLEGEAKRWIEEIAKDLEKHEAASIVLAGDQQPPIVHVIAHAINAKLGNVGNTVWYTEPPVARFEDQTLSIKSLATDMAAKDDSVRVLLILGGNPVFDAPADFGFAKALKELEEPAKSQGAPLRVHLSSLHDETSQVCDWHIPQSHFLETWGDTRAYDGSAGVQQPLIQSLYASKSVPEVLAALLGEGPKEGMELVQGHWKATLNSPEFDKLWRRILHSGVIEGTQLPSKVVTLRTEALTAAPAAVEAPKEGEKTIEVSFRADPTLWDGRYANNGWLQETPKAITRIVWDNAVLISPRTAAEWNVKSNEMVEIAFKDRKASGVIWLQPGQADGSVTLTLGYGRQNVGQVANGTGFDVYPLRRSDAAWIAGGATITKLRKQHKVACVQDHQVVKPERMFQVVHVEEPGTLGKSADAHHGGGAHPGETGHAGTAPQVGAAPAPGAPAPGAGHEAPGGVPATDSHGSDHGHAATSTTHGSGPEVDHRGTWRDSKLNQEGLPSLYSGYDYRDHKWGMVVNLNACIGCNTCMVACTSENNIATVGKTEVLNGREMHWIRIDRYYEGTAENPTAMHHQPMLCQHCENAPCEPVCPVGATTHSHEGLNEMTYNRCVGTRYCANNCPYKVRRFNFFQYSDIKTESLKLMRNPDVTVRDRGVMEKCTYCVQRISRARITAKKENRRIRDGEVTPACVGACPTETLIFGDLNDPTSRVAKAYGNPTRYGVLEELGTRPRTTYLARVRNPNPELATAHDEAKKDS